jgi:hypothetical protein
MRRSGNGPRLRAVSRWARLDSNRDLPIMSAIVRLLGFACIRGNGSVKPFSGSGRSGVCLISRGSCGPTCGPTPRPRRRVEEVRVAQPVIDQVDVGAEREGGSECPSHICTCLGFLPLANRIDAGVAEGVEARPRHPRRLRRRLEDVLARPCAVDPLAASVGEDQLARPALPCPQLPRKLHRERHVASAVVGHRRRSGGPSITLGDARLPLRLPLRSAGGYWAGDV